MSEAFLGELRIFGFNFPPLNWALANGALLPISQNTALFSLLGTNYGGNGVSTFQLPNCVSNAVIGAGSGPGLSTYDVGETGGSQTVTITTTESPPHSHQFQTANLRIEATTNVPATNFVFTSGTGCKPYLPAGSIAGNKPMSPLAMTPFAGGSQGHENRMPALVLNYCVCINGIFPQRP